MLHVLKSISLYTYSLSNILLRIIASNFIKVYAILIFFTNFALVGHTQQRVEKAVHSNKIVKLYNGVINNQPHFTSKYDSVKIAPGS